MGNMSGGELHLCWPVQSDREHAERSLDPVALSDLRGSSTWSADTPLYAVYDDWNSAPPWTNGAFSFYNGQYNCFDLNTFACYNDDLGVLADPSTRSLSRRRGACVVTSSGGAINMKYDRRKFLKLGGTAAVGIAIAAAVESSASCPPACCGTDSTAKPVPTPTSTCAAATNPTSPADDGNLCMINATSKSLVSELNPVLTWMDAGDENHPRLAAIQDLLSDPPDGTSVADQLYLVALVLWKIKICGYKTSVDHPDKNGTGYDLLVYIDKLLRDLFNRLQLECNDKALADRFTKMTPPGSNDPIKTYLDDIWRLVEIVKQHLAAHHFNPQCKNSVSIRNSK
jgi:hypothetical protein